MSDTNAVRSVKSWKRRPWSDPPPAEDDGAHLFRTEMFHIYEGVIEGESVMQYLFANMPDGTTGGYVALEKVTGSVEGKSGTFVLQHTGSYGTGKLISTITVLRGGGTGELSDLAGHIHFETNEHADSYPIQFDYRFEQSQLQEPS